MQPQSGYYDQQTGQWVSVTQTQTQQQTGYGYDEYGGYYDQSGNYYPAGGAVHWWSSWSCCKSFAWTGCWAWLMGAIVFAMLVLGVIGFFLALANGSCLTMVMNDLTALTATVDSQGQLLAQMTTPLVFSASGALGTTAQIQTLACGAVCAMSLPGDLTPYVGLPEVCLFAGDAFAHTLTLTAPALFNSGDSVATFGGAVGDNICFKAISATVAAVKSINGVVLS